MNICELFILGFQPWVFVGEIVRAIDKARFVHGAHEHLEPNDGVNDDDEDDKEGDLDERKERHHDCIEHNLNITSYLEMGSILRRYLV